MTHKSQNEMNVRKHIKNSKHNTQSNMHLKTIQLSGHCSYCTLPRSHLHKERLGPTYLVIKLQAPSVKHNEIGRMLRKGQVSARFLGCREETLQLYQTLRCRRVSLNVEEGTATVLECREEGHLLFHTLRCSRGSLDKRCT